MEIQFLAHASVVLRWDGAALLADPWFQGKAFNESWALHPGPDIDWDELADIRYLWISHEHPDHFSLPTLRAFPEELRRRVTVLYQARNTDKIFDAFRALGFSKFLSLPNRSFVALDGAELYGYQAHLGDSCLGVRQGGDSVFNVNDAELDSADARRIVAEFGRPDAVLNQFSLAGYAGHRERERFLPLMAREKLDRIRNNHAQLGAGLTIPFASFVRSCCTDNAYLNASHNRPGQVAAFLRESGCRCLFLAPGQRYAVHGQTGAYEANIAIYDRLFDEVPALPLDPAQLVGLEALKAAFARFSEGVHAGFARALLRWVPDLNLHVDDLGLSLRASLGNRTLEPVALAREECDLWLNAQPLWYGFHHPWGLETLGVSARYTVNRRFGTWKIWKNLSILYNQGIHLNARFFASGRNVTWLAERLRSGLLRQMARKSWRALGLRRRARLAG
jgi:hypothetical protein